MKFKLTLTAILFFTLCFTSFSQGAKIKFHTERTKVEYPALVKPLTKGNKYQLILPEKLTYYQSRQQMQIERVLFPYSDMFFKPKMSRDNPDVSFLINAKGVSNVNASGIRSLRNGFVINYAYNFPCSLIVQDSAQKYTINIFSDTEVLYVDYNKSLPAYGDLGYQPLNFASEKEAADFMATNKDIQKYIEKYAMLSAYKRIAKIIPVLYTDNGEKMDLGWADISDDKGIAEYIELNKAATHLKEAYKLMDESKKADAEGLLLSAKQIFEKYSKIDNQVIDIAVKKMIYYNLGWASLLTGDIKNAKDAHLKNTEIAGNSIFNIAGLDEMEKGINNYELRENVRNGIVK